MRHRPSMKGKGKSQPLLLKMTSFNNNSWHNAKSSCCTGWNHSFEKEMMSCNHVFQADTRSPIRSSISNVPVHLNYAINQHNSNLWLHFTTRFCFIFVLCIIMATLCSSVVIFVHMMNKCKTWLKSDNEQLYRETAQRDKVQRQKEYFMRPIVSVYIHTVHVCPQNTANLTFTHG